MKNTAKWLLVVLLGLILAIGAAACGEGSHTHTAGGEWQSDAAQHWHVCTDCDEVMDEAAHTAGEWQQDAATGEHFRVCTVCGRELDRAAHTKGSELQFNADYTRQWYECTVCGAKVEEAAHTHTAADAWTSDAEGHWHVCTVCGQAADAAEAHGGEWAFDEASGKEIKVCPDCGYKTERGHEHIAGEWQQDAATGEHFRVCTDCGTEIERAAHTKGDELQFNADYTRQWYECTVCGAKVEETVHTHTAADAWTSDAEGHWHVCTVCGQAADAAEAHGGEWAYNAESGKDECVCTVCGYKADRTHEHDPGAVWLRDGDTHWRECKICGGKVKEAAHSGGEWVEDGSGHARVCEVCSQTYDKQAHTPGSEWGHDETQHWKLCSACGADVEAAAHTFAWAEGAGNDAGKYVYACECGYSTKSVSMDITPADGVPYIELSEESAQLTITLPEGFAYASLQLGGEDLGAASFEGGTATVATDAFAEAKLGEETALTVLAAAEGKQYAFTLRVTVVTKLIETAEDLDAVKYVGTNITGYFLVVADIDASDTTISGSKYGNWNQNDGFRGTFDGNGCTISGLTVQTYGIFGQVGGGGVVKDVRFEDVYLGANAGLFARFAYNCTFENIYVSYRGFAGNSGDEGGLLVGRQMSNNVFWTDVTLEAYDLEIPSLLGQNVELRGKPDVAYPIVFTNVLIRARSYKTIGTDLASDAEITSLPSGITFEEYAREQTLVEEEVFFENVTDSSASYTLENAAFTAGTEYTVAVGAQHVQATAGEGSLTFTLGGITLGKNAVVCTSGEQNITFANVWFVTKALSTAEDLETVRYKGSGSPIEGYYVLKNDIDLNGAQLSAGSYAWDGKVGFHGVFDGNGKMIANFKVGQNGFFGMVGGSGDDPTVIKDVTFDQVTMVEQWQSGVLAAFLYSATVENVTVNLVSVGAGAQTNQGLLISRYINGTATTLRNVTVNAQGLDIGGNISLISYDASTNTKYENVVFNVGSYVYVSQNATGVGEMTQAPAGVTINVG